METDPEEQMEESGAWHPFLSFWMRSPPPQQRERVRSHQLLSCKVMLICLIFPHEAYIVSQARVLPIRKIEMGAVIKN